MFRRVLSLLAIVVVATMLAAVGAQTAGARATSTIYIRGTVSCQWHQVVGVWVEVGNGGSGWADFQPISPNFTNIATYAAKIQNTSLPTNVRLHVGCGGTSSAWFSDNRTGSTSRAGGPLNGSATLNAVCNEPESVAPAPGDNQRCWFGGGSVAAAWAVQHLGAYSPSAGDAGTSGISYWSGWCLAFAASAYTSTWAEPNPIVHTTALDMFNTYRNAGLVHSSSGVPPVGAFAFYPGDSSDGHIAISIGHRKVISTQGLVGDRLRVAESDYTAFAGGYQGWAYPTNAFR